MPDPSPPENGERVKLCLSILAVDHGTLGEGCGEDVCNLCLIEATLKEIQAHASSLERQLESARVALREIAAAKAEAGQPNRQAHLARRALASLDSSKGEGT